MNTLLVERAIIANRPGEPFVLIEVSPPDIEDLSTLDWQAPTDPPTWDDVTAWVPELQALPATAGDHRQASDQIITSKLASIPVPVGDLPTILEELLSQAASAIPFFEQYALDPSMTAQQWTDFQALPQQTKDRLLYDVVRSLASLMRYLTGELRTS